MENNLIGFIIHNCRIDQNISIRILSEYTHINKNKILRIETGDVVGLEKELHVILDELGYAKISFGMIHEMNNRLNKLFASFYQRVLYSNFDFGKIVAELEAINLESDGLIKYFPHYILLMFIYECISNKLKDLDDYESAIKRNLEYFNNDEISIFYDFCYTKRFITGKLEEAILYLNKAKMHTCRDDILSVINYHYGVVYTMKGDCFVSLHYLNIALDLFSKTDNYIKRIYANLSIGKLYCESGAYTKAKEIYLSCYDNMQKFTISNGVKAIICRNLAWINLVLNDKDKIISYVEESMTFDITSSLGYFYIVFTYYKLEDKEQLNHWIKLMKENVKKRDYSYDLSIAVKKMASNYEDSVSLLIKAYDKIVDTDKEMRFMVLKLIIEYYKYYNSYENIIYYQNKLIELCRMF